GQEAGRYRGRDTDSGRRLAQGDRPGAGNGPRTAGRADVTRAGLLAGRQAVHRHMDTRLRHHRRRRQGAGVAGQHGDARGGARVHALVRAADAYAPFGRVRADALPLVARPAARWPVGLEGSSAPDRTQSGQTGTIFGPRDTDSATYYAHDWSDRDRRVTRRECKALVCTL